MKRLPLYPDGREAAVEKVSPEDCPEDCTKCSLGTSGNIASAVGDAGGVLLVGESPTLGEVQGGAPPFHFGSGLRVSQIVRRFLRGRSLAADYGLRCPTGKKRVTKNNLDACRPHVASTIEVVQPELILCFGPQAANSVLGRSVSALQVGTCVDWLSDGTPVFTFPRVADIMQNQFRREQFTEDIAVILKDDLPMPPRINEFVLIEAFDLAQTKAICADLRKREWFAFDTETDGIMWTDYFQINTLAVCVKGKRTPVVWGEQALRNPQIRNELSALMKDPRATKVAHNLKFDAHASNNFFGEGFAGFGMCTLLAARLIEADTAGDLESLAEKVGMGGHKLEAKAALLEARKPVRNMQKGLTLPQSRRDMQMMRYATRSEDSWAYGFIPEDVRNRYCALDTLACLLLAERFEEEMPEQQQTHWDKVVSKTTEAVVQVEAWGISIDGKHLSAYRSELTKQMSNWESSIRHDLENLTTNDSALQSRVHRLLPDGYNPGSSPQTATLLYEALGLAPGKTTATGKPSVDRDSLNLISRRRGHEGALAQHILEWRKAQKLKSTYTEGMSQHIRDDGRIHPSLNIAGTRTGRLSCRSPNLQNIPRAKGSPDAKHARNIFCAPEGYTLMDADYSQLELRVAAGLSGDPKMKAIFDEGVDYHLKSAQLISQIAWGISPDMVKDEHRSAAKTVNFGLLYGQGIPMLAAGIGCTNQMAEKIQNAILGEFNVLAKWIQQQLLSAKASGGCWTYWEGELARWRPLTNIASPDRKAAGTAERSSWNTPIQGSASDFCLASLVECVDWLKADFVPAKLVLTVHDSLVFQVANEAVEEVAEGVKDIMGTKDCNGVPLEVDIAVGQSWGEMQEYLNDAEVVATALGFSKTAVAD